MTFMAVIGIAVICWLVKELDLLTYIKEKIHNGTRKQQ